MRKMRANYTFKPRLVASGEWDNDNKRYLLDNNLEINKLYLIKVHDDSTFVSSTFILSTIVDFKLSDSGEDDLFESTACTRDLEKTLTIRTDFYTGNKKLGQYLYMSNYEDTLNNDTCHVYEIYIG